MWRTQLLKWTARLEIRLATTKIRVARSLGGTAHRLARKLLAPRGLCRAKLDGLSMYLHANTSAFKQYVVWPFEPYTVELFKGAVRPGATILDIGAQFGYFSLLAGQQAGPEGRVYAFEPVPANFDLLRRNIEMNGLSSVVQPVQKAVSDERADVDMFVYKRSDSHSMYRHPRARVREVISVESVTIDEFLRGRPADVVKMDIEGNELRALKGMKETILKSPELVMFVEFNPLYLARADVNPKDLLAGLDELGFDVQVIDDRSSSLRSLSRDDLEPREPSWYANLYCVRGPERGRR